ncbi:MAG: hypothetical protein KKH12_08795 [Gammaproteobacteria bacterium]|nr:hypothetical protein [Gammaproteobacteria bacterium]MBU1481762.1 hypothetical protein [Gammaproteobacteria bacterium]
MKLKALVVSCALAFAGSAAALPASTTPDVTLYVSGSSALSNMSGNIATHILDAATIDVFYSGTLTAPNGKDSRAYFGRANAAAIATYPNLETAPGSGIGKAILIIKRDKGGSFEGVNPVALSTPTAALDLAGCGATTAVIDAGTGLAVHGCPTNINRVPDAGLSDVEPATLEAAVNLPAGQSALTAAQIAAMNVQGVVGVIMAPVVTDTAPAGVHNLSKAQIGALMGGLAYDWNQIDSSIPAGTTSIVVCRRGAGSGTQATINAHIFGNPCMTGATNPMEYTATTATLGDTVNPVAPGNIVVVENSSSGFVKSCMLAARDGGIIDTRTGALTAGPTSVRLGGGDIAIGLLGVDSGLAAGYVFASVNGSAPTVENAANGHYDIVGQATVQDRGDLTGDKASVYALWRQYTGDPSILGVAGSGGAPVAGVLALSENGFAATVPFDPTNPVMRVGTFGNICSPAALLQ